jgi:hypothetical protein
MGGKSLLGPLSHSWSLRLQRNAFGSPELVFWNAETNSSSLDDPRLGELPSEWERMELKRTPDSALICAPHQNKLTRDIINSDPRMSAEALTARGVKLEDFRLV